MRTGVWRGDCSDKLVVDFYIEWVKNVAYELNYGFGFILILLGKLELVCDLAMKSNIMIMSMDYCWN